MDESDGYKLVEEDLLDEEGSVCDRISVLANAGRDSFLAKMRSSKQERHNALLISFASMRLMGTSKNIALATKLLKPLSDSSGIYAFEMRPKPRVSTIRVMVYLPDDDTRHAVLLFAFKGHRGDKGRIPQEELDKAKRLAGVAETLFRRRLHLSLCDKAH